MPTIPAIPGRTFGAGNGSFKNEKTTPTKKPVNNAKIDAFNLTPHFSLSTLLLQTLELLYYTTKIIYLHNISFIKKHTPPSVLNASMVPSCHSIIALVIASPKPVSPSSPL